MYFFFLYKIFIGHWQRIPIFAYPCHQLVLSDSLIFPTQLGVKWRIIFVLLFYFLRKFHPVFIFLILLSISSFESSLVVCQYPFLINFFVGLPPFSYLFVREFCGFKILFRVFTNIRGFFFLQYWI